MIDLFIEGGFVFMGLLTIVLLVIFVLTVSNFLAIKKGKDDPLHIAEQLGLIKNVGLFGLMLGIFAQLRGLYQMFDAIQEIGDVSPSLLAGGLKVSMLTTEYGAGIFLIAYLLWFGLNAILAKKGVVT